ncbi:DegV family protein [soil metagenome]
MESSGDIANPNPSTPARVAVVTDTTTYMPPELLEGLGVETVSLYVGWDGDLRPEHEYTDLDAFYTRLAESEKLPTTSQPSRGDFEAVFEPIVASGRDVVSIHIASGLSGTLESAQEAAKTLAERGHPGTIHALDGETGAGGLGCLVLTAARAAAEGADAQAVLEAVAHAQERLEIWFCLDTLKYLRKGGRIGAAQAMVGEALQVKPILTFGTEIAPVGRVRTNRRALARMEEYLKRLHENGAKDWIVQHAQSADDAAHLVEYGRSVFGSDPAFCTEVGPVLGAHLGRGMLVGGVAG